MYVRRAAGAMSMDIEESEGVLGEDDRPYALVALTGCVCRSSLTRLQKRLCGRATQRVQEAPLAGARKVDS